MVSVGPADGVQMLPEGAIKGEGVEGGVHLAEVTEVHGREEGEHPQEQLRGEVQEGRCLLCICTDKHTLMRGSLSSPPIFKLIWFYQQQSQSRGFRKQIISSESVCK